MNSSELPPLYQSENYFKCIRNGKKFCMVVAQLNSLGNSSWENLTMEEKLWSLNRRFVHRGLCLQRSEGSEQSVITQVIPILKSRLNSQNVTIDDIYCQKELSPMTTLDKTFLAFLLAIYMFVTVGTLLDTKNKKYKNSLENVLVKFSLKENWKKITKTEGTGDFNRLKSIQGLRVLTNIGVMSIHCGLAILVEFYKNPEVLEKLVGSPITQVVCNMGSIIVHIFFVISAFLFSNQVYSHQEKNGSFTFKDFLVLTTNRYFRLYIPTLFFVCLSQISILDPILGVPNMKFFNMNRKACQERWSEVIFFSNNFSKLKDMCYCSTWYLSADFQAYILLVFLIYVVLKYKLNSVKVMLIALMVSIIIYGIYIYLTGMEYITYKFALVDIQQNYLQDSYPFKVQYTSTLSTLPTSITGMIFGYIYFKTKKLEIKGKNEVHHILWFLMFFGLPALSVYLASCRYNKLLTAILGSIVKVIFTTGIGIGIVGMSHGLGGKIRKYLEGKFNIFLGNISFSVYLFNFFVVTLAEGGGPDLSTLSTFFAVRGYVKLISVSILAGLMLSLTIEQPFLSIQKTILPQLSKKTDQPKKKE